MTEEGVKGDEDPALGVVHEKENLTGIRESDRDLGIRNIKSINLNEKDFTQKVVTKREDRMGDGDLLVWIENEEKSELKRLIEKRMSRILVIRKQLKIHH